MESLSDRIAKANFTNVTNFIRVKDVKESFKEILFHKKCMDCKLNICNCGKENWVVDINVIKEEAGPKLIESQIPRTKSQGLRKRPERSTKLNS